MLIQVVKDSSNILRIHPLLYVSYLYNNWLGECLNVDVRLIVGNNEQQIQQQMLLGYKNITGNFAFKIISNDVQRYIFG